MRNADHDDLSPAEFESQDRLDDDFIPDDALPLCAKCLKPCHPLQYYCDECDSYDAINPLTPYIGFVNIWFNYDIFLTMWRKIWGDNRMALVFRLFYLLLIFMYVPIMPIVGVPTFLIYKIPQGQVRNVVYTLFLLTLIALFLLYAYFWTPWGLFL